MSKEGKPVSKDPSVGSMQDFPERRQRREQKKQRRRMLRKTMTPAEAALWRMLKNRQLAGRKFRRQHSAGPYILDFYCSREKLAVELDGDVHNDPRRQAYDDERTASLRRHGIQVVRFENREVFEDPERVVQAIAWHFRNED